MCFSIISQRNLLSIFVWGKFQSISIVTLTNYADVKVHCKRSISITLWSARVARFSCLREIGIA